MNESEIKEIYNFSDAEVVCEWHNGYPEEDFRCCHETLYRDKYGRFMLVGCGGPMSPYGIRQGERYVEGEVCRLIEKLEVLNWLTLRRLPEKISECFPNFAD